MNAALRPQLTSKTLVQRQTANDIINAIRRAVNDSREGAKVECKKFADENPVRSCEKVWEFLKRKMTYEAEPEELQNAKTIQRILHDKIGDCKHYTTYSFSVLSALGIPCIVRLVSQDEKKKDPTHIYTVAVINGKEYVVDPCMNRFNKECKYFYKCDFKQKDMLNYLQGVQGVDDIGFGKKHKSHPAASKVKAKFKKAEKKFVSKAKAEGKKIKTVGNKIKQRIAVVPKETAKKAFLNAVMKNRLDLATRLKRGYRAHPEDLKQFWKKYGDWSELRDAINKGDKGSSAIGLIDDAVHAGFSIIKEILQWLKERKMGQAGDDQEVQDLSTQVMADPNIPKIDGNGDPAPANDTEGTKSVQTFQTSNPPMTVSEAPTDTTTTDTTTTDNTPAPIPPPPPAADDSSNEMTTSTKVLLYGGGALILAKVFKVF